MCGKHGPGVERLLAAKADVEIADEQGWRALQWAAQIGPVEMVQFLLESGATVDTARPTGDGRRAAILRFR